MKTLSNNSSCKYYKNVLHQKGPLHTLNDICIEFVVTLINKANGNVALCSVLCSFFIKELPLNQNATSTIKTYLQVKKTNSQITF